MDGARAPDTQVINVTVICSSGDAAPHAYESCAGRVLCKAYISRADPPSASRIAEHGRYHSAPASHPLSARRAACSAAAAGSSSAETQPGHCRLGSWQTSFESSKLLPADSFVIVSMRPQEFVKLEATRVIKSEGLAWSDGGDRLGDEFEPIYSSKHVVDGEAAKQQLRDDQLDGCSGPLQLLAR